MCLWQVISPFFCAGFEESNQRVTRTAPILRKWLRGMHLRQVWNLCARKGWQCTLIDPGDVRDVTSTGVNGKDAFRREQRI